MKNLEDCNVGEFVTLWCIGIRRWDDDVVKIISKGIFIDIKYRSGRTASFSPDTKCKLASF